MVDRSEKAWRHQMREDAAKKERKALFKAPVTEANSSADYELYDAKKDPKSLCMEMVVKEDRGWVYFVNIKTQHTQWERPVGTQHEHLPCVWMEELCSAGDPDAEWLTEDRPFWFDNAGHVTWFNPGGPYAPCSDKIMDTKRGQPPVEMRNEDGSWSLAGQGIVSDGGKAFDFDFHGRHGGRDASGTLMVSYAAAVKAPDPPPPPRPPPQPEMHYRTLSGNDKVFQEVMKNTEAVHGPVQSRDIIDITRASLPTQEQVVIADNIIAVGARVVSPHGDWGHVRWMGEIYGKPGKWCGLEMEEAVGHNAGEVDTPGGMLQLFECPAGHGLFLHTASLARAQDAVRIFHDMDVEQHGVLSLEDLSCYLSDYGFTTQEIIMLFLRLDANHDQHISLEEFVQSYKDWVHQMESVGKR